MSSIFDKIAAALDSALNSEDHQSILESDAEAAARREKELAGIPKPGALGKADRDVQAAMKKLAEAAEAREGLLALGRQFRQMRANLERLEARLQRGLESIAAVEAQANEAWAYAQESFGDPRDTTVSAGNASNALQFEGTAEAMRMHLVPKLQAEVDAARKAVEAFAKKHDLAAVEAAEAESIE